MIEKILAHLGLEPRRPPSRLAQGSAAIDAPKSARPPRTGGYGGGGY